MSEPALDYSYYDGDGGSDASAVRYKTLPHQGRVYLSPKKLIFMGGGVGCGKTDIGSLWTLKKAVQTPPNVVGMICANTYTQLLDSTMWNVYRNFKKWNVDVRPRELPKVSRPFNIHVWNGRYFVEIRCRSLDAYNTLSGQEIGWAWADEVFMTKKEAIDVVMARLRDRRIIGYREGFDVEEYGEGRLQMLFTTVLDEPSSWMHEVFVDKFDPKRMMVIYAKTADNIFLDDDYIPGLKVLYSPQMFKRMVESQWVTLEGGRIYYNFDRLVHVNKVAEYVPGLKVYWSHDFNIGQEKPMSSCLAQILKAEGPDGKMRPEIHFFDEIVIELSLIHI